MPECPLHSGCAAVRRAKLQSNHHHQQTNTQLFTGHMPSCYPTNSVKALKGKRIMFYGLAHTKLIWALQHCLWPIKAPSSLEWRLPSSRQPSDVSNVPSKLQICAAAKTLPCTSRLAPCSLTCDTMCVSPFVNVLVAQETTSNLQPLLHWGSEVSHWCPQVSVPSSPTTASKPSVVQSIVSIEMSIY